MLKVIFLSLLITALCEEYNDKADEEYKTKTSSKRHVFPMFKTFHTNTKQKFEVTSNGATEIVFKVIPGEDPLYLQTLHGKIILSSFVFSLEGSAEDNLEDKVGTRCTLRFSWPNNTPNKIIIGSQVFTPPSDERLQGHAQKHAARIEPFTVREIEDLINQSEQQTKHITIKTQWIGNLLSKGKPLFIPTSQSNSVRVYMSPPSLLNADVLGKLVDLKRALDKDSRLDQFWDKLVPAAS